MDFEKPNLIKDKSYQFALRIISLYRQMQGQNEYVLSKQLLRAGTGIGANVEEVSAAQSRKDFATKEVRETHYWLRLIRDSRLCMNIDVDPLIEDREELIRMLTAIVKTAQKSC